MDNDKIKDIIRQYGSKYRCLEPLSKMPHHAIQDKFSVIHYNYSILLYDLLTKVVASLEGTGDSFVIEKEIDKHISQLSEDANKMYVSRGEPPKYRTPEYKYVISYTPVISDNCVKMVDMDFFSIAHLINRYQFVGESLEQEMLTDTRSAAKQFRDQSGPKFVTFQYRNEVERYMREAYRVKNNE